MPTLYANGPLTSGSTFDLELATAAPNALMLAGLSFASTPLVIFGGTIHANPPSRQFLRVSDGTGAWSQSVGWPAGVTAGIDIYLQFLIQDLSVPAQITLSNAMMSTTS